MNIGVTIWLIAGSATVATLVLVVVLLARRLRRTREELGRMRQLSQDRMDSMAVLSHEIRTPLALIMGPVQLLQEQSPGPLTPQQERFVETIRVNAEHLQGLSEDVLTQSRIESGMFPMRRERVDLRVLGIRVVAELRTLHKLSIALDCPGAPPIVSADPRLLLQALTNLLTNACRHSRGNIVVLRIQRQTTTTLVSVDDHGVGMSASRRAAAFERFSTTAPELGGVGLGMLITREIVRMHGSRLHVQSMPDAGTTMMFALPNIDRREKAEEKT